MQLPIHNNARILKSIILNSWHIRWWLLFFSFVSFTSPVSLSPLFSSSTFPPDSPFCFPSDYLISRIPRFAELVNRICVVFNRVHTTQWPALSVSRSTVAQSLTPVDLKWSPPTSVVTWPWWCIDYIYRKNEICFEALFKISKKIVLFYYTFYHNSLWWIF